MPFRTGWGDFLSKYFKPMPAGFTSNYFFEFEEGWCTFRHLVTTPDDQAVHHKMCDDITGTRSAILQELFGVLSIQDAKMIQLTLPRHKGRKLKSTKLKSLAKKFFSIPEKFISYYPDVQGIDTEEVDHENKQLSINLRSRRKKVVPGVAQIKKRKVGRPKQVRDPASIKSKSILLYFQRQ